MASGWPERLAWLRGHSPNGLAFMWASECDLFQSRSFHLESRRLVRSLRPQLIPLGLPIWRKKGEKRRDDELWWLWMEARADTHAGCPRLRPAVRKTSTWHVGTNHGVGAAKNTLTAEIRNTKCLSTKCKVPSCGVGQGTAEPPYACVAEGCGNTPAPRGAINVHPVSAPQYS